MKYFIANWKMNMGIKEMLAWFEEFSTLQIDRSGEKIIIVCPSYPHLPLAKEVTDSLEITLGAQDVSSSLKGAHTGETGGFQIKELCKYSIVGHSERKETEDVVKKKVNMCLQENIIPIVCFVNPENAVVFYKEGVILCWEDPNNISVDGKYRDKDPKEIVKGITLIRKQIPEEALLIYGGSVNRKNIQDLKKIDKIDGVLVGNASLEAGHFADIINSQI